MGALAEFERDLIRERTNAGLAAARANRKVKKFVLSLPGCECILVKFGHWKEMF